MPTTPISKRETIFELRRRLGCTEGDAAALIAAAAQGGRTAELKQTIGDWETPPPGGNRPHGALTTIITDESGDYVLETERKKSNSKRLAKRPSRMTFLISSRGRDGQPTTLAVAARLAFANMDDGIAISHAESIRPMIARGAVDLDEITATIAEAFFITDYADDETRAAEQRKQFEALTGEAVLAALAPPNPNKVAVQITVVTHATVGPKGQTMATATARATDNWPDHEAEATVVRQNQEEAVGKAATLAIEYLTDDADDSLARAAALEAPDDDRR